MTQKRKSIGVVEEDCGSPARAALCTTAASTSTTADEKNTQAVFETTPPLWTTAPAEKKAKIACAAAVVSSSSSSTPNGGSNNAAAAQAQPSSTEPQPPGPPKTASNRCSACRNKVGLLGFRCCCGETFCGTHRYAEKHACSFDYKRAGRERIANNNLVVIDKIVKI